MNDDPYYDTHYVGLGEPTKQVTVEIERWGMQFGFFSAQGWVKFDGQTYWFWFSFAADTLSFGVFPQDTHPDNRYMESSAMLYGERRPNVTGFPHNSGLHEGEAAVLLMDFAVKFAVSQMGTR